MPPSRKRARRYDPAKTRTAVLAQVGHVGEAIVALTDEQLALPTRLGDWTVRDLAAHLTTAVDAVPRSLALPAPVRQELTLLDWPSVTGRHAEPNAERTKAVAASAGPAELFGHASARIADALAETPDERLVETRAGAMSLGDLLVTRCVELVVHTDDMNHATGLAIPYDRQALAACTRLLADALAAKAPGASTEVRVPPFAVVQCVEGPRHTRGTPPNVVETDALTWIRLATGRTEWKTARDGAKLSASGERADLSALLPVMR